MVSIEVFYIYEFSNIQIPLEEFGKLVHNQLQDFKLIKNSEEDLSILQPYRSQGKPITVVTYQKDEKFYETNHKFKGKILIAFS
uniref:Uncharacterized protein n=1 Tax=Acrobeloides nanus TaxID=290746 RepID=A0A914DHJ2_9BILA